MSTQTYHDSEKGTVSKIIFVLLGIIFFPAFISSLLFLFRISIGTLSFPIGIALLLIIYTLLFFKKSNLLSFFISLAIAFALAATAILVSCYLWDSSYDGWMYHAPAVIKLSNGWNPIFEHTSHAQFSELDYRIWIEHYPKFLWIYGATLYNFTNNIFAGTSANIILSICSFLVFVMVFRKNKALPKVILYMSAFIVAFNSVLISQLFTYYNDGALGNALISLLILCYGVGKGYLPLKNNFLVLFLFTAYSCLLINTKFSYALMTTVILVIFFIYFLIIGQFKKQTKTLVLYILVISSVIIISAFSSYWINYTYHHNLGYPLVGYGKVDIITNNTPNILFGYGKYEAFLRSLVIDKFHYYNQLVFKYSPPYYISLSDIVELAKNTDVRLSGFGPSFQLILLTFLTLVVTQIFHLFARIFKSKKQKNAEVQLKVRRTSGNIAWHDRLYFTEILIILLFCGFIIMLPVIWWARYIPFLFVLPLLIIILFKQDWTLNKFSSLLAGFMLVIYLLSGAVLIGYRVYYAHSDSSQIKNDISHFKQIYEKSEKPLEIVNYAAEGNFYKMPVVRELFKINDIEYIEYDENDSNLIIFDEDNSLGIARVENIVKPEFKMTEALVVESDIYGYFDIIHANINDIIVIISVKDDASTYADKLIDLPFSFVKLPTIEFQQSYIGIISNDGNLLEIISDEAIEFTFANTVTVWSAGYIAGNYSDILINDINYSKDMRGLNICVLDKETLTLIDSVNIDVYWDENLLVQR